MYPLTRGCGNGIDINNNDNNKRSTGTDHNSQSILQLFFIVIVRHSCDLIIVGIIKTSSCYVSLFVSVVVVWCLQEVPWCFYIVHSTRNATQDPHAVSRYESR